MNLDGQIDIIRKEVGKSRKDKGAKVKLIAIRFEERFRNDIFDIKHLETWIKSEPELTRYKSSAQVRHALQQAGTRTDLPRTFEIVRVGKSSWALHPPEDYFNRGAFSKAIVAEFQKENRKVRQLLQALDWDNLDKHQRLTIVSQYRFYKTCLEHVRIDVSNMTHAIQDLSSEFLALEPPK